MVSKATIVAAAKNEKGSKPSVADGPLCEGQSNRTLQRPSITSLQWLMAPLPDASVRGTPLGGIAVALIGAITLMGWLTELRALSAVRPRFIPVAPNTAVLFILLGVSLCTVGSASPLAVLFARCALGLSMLVAGTRLAEYLSGADLSVDHWIFSFPSEHLGLAPVGKMAFFTAATFVVACLALLPYTFARRRRWMDDVVRALALLVTLIGAGFSLGYVYDAPLLYGGKSIPMALPTAAAFLILGLSILIPAMLRDRTERRQAERAMRMAHDDLEQHVAERTTELELSNEYLQDTVVELEERTVEAELARQEAHAAEQRYRALVDGLAIGVVLMFPEGIKAANPSAARILGVSTDQMLQRAAIDSRWHTIHEDGTAFPGEAHPPVVTLRTGESQRSVVMGVHRPDDTFAWIEVSSDPLFRPGEAAPYAAVASFVDITERRRNEEELRKSEEQLLQAQKMEAIGQLAGGVAHDFNNMLTAIKSYTDLLLSDDQLDDNQRSDLDEIRKAADRASALTRQLLAVSRKQVLHLRPTNLNTVVSDLEDMLRRLTVGDVELVTALEPEAGLVTVDPGQIDQVLMNLVVNARDAMPEGGRITIQTSSVELDEAYCQKHPTAQTGPHVMLAVSDTGHGMDEATRARIFEPFFTTKELGCGTGLGLSTAYGIVKQSGGHIWVYSEVGHGSIFKIYFPRVDNLTELPTESVEVASVSRGSETILLVDDDESIRVPVRKILERSGYTVLEAAGGTHALHTCEEYAHPIDLVITDMMMPGMHGRELMEHMAKARPHAKVLFTSGYTDDQIIRRGLLDADMAFIQKPFNLVELVGKVRAVLQSPEPDGSLSRAERD